MEDNKPSSAVALSLRALARRSVHGPGALVATLPGTAIPFGLDAIESRSVHKSFRDEVGGGPSSSVLRQSKRQVADAKGVDQGTGTKRVQQSRLGESYAMERRINQLNELARTLRERVIRGEFTLPMLPAQALVLLEVGVARTMEMKELERFVTSDPMIAARVLSLANAASFIGTRGSATTIRAACLRLGVRGIQDLLVQAVAETHIYVGVQKQIASQDIEHCVLVAALARRGADLVGQSHELAFTCGLLHDIGRPLVWHVLHSTALPNLDLEARQTLVDFLHPLVGERAARQWRLPGVVADVARFHHCHRGAPADVGFSPLVALVAAADRLASLQRLRSQDWASKIVLEEAWLDLKLPETVGDTWLSYANRLATQRKGS